MQIHLCVIYYCLQLSCPSNGNYSSSWKPILEKSAVLSRNCICAKLVFSFIPLFVPGCKTMVFGKIWGMRRPHLINKYNRSFQNHWESSSCLYTKLILTLSSQEAQLWIAGWLSLGQEQNTHYNQAVLHPFLLNFTFRVEKALFYCVDLSSLAELYFSVVLCYSNLLL